MPGAPPIVNTAERTRSPLSSRGSNGFLELGENSFVLAMWRRRHDPRRRMRGRPRLAQPTQRGVAERVAALFDPAFHPGVVLDVAGGALPKTAVVSRPRAM